jgi:PAS domain S-box-containing protein
LIICYNAAPIAELGGLDPAITHPSLRRNMSMDLSRTARKWRSARGPESRADAKTTLASEKKLRDLAESMPMIVWTATPEGEIDYVSPLLSDYTGIALRSPAATGWRESIHPDDLDRCLIEWGHSISTREPYEIEYRIRRIDGEYRWFRVQVLPTGRKDGPVIKWYGTAIDIHETKTLQEEALAAAKSLTTTLESITDAFITLGKDWRLTYVNAAAEKLLGQPRSMLLGRNVWQEFPHWIESFGLPYHRAVQEGVDVSFEVHFEANDTWLDVHAFPSSEGLVTHLRDITEQKHSAMRLQEQALILTNAQRIGFMGTWDMNVFSGDLAWSEQTCSLFGINAAEFEGTFDHFLTFVLPEYRPALVAEVEKTKVHEGPLVCEYRILRPDGQIRWMYLRASIDGDPARRMGMVMDISDRHHAARELRTAFDALEERVESRTSELALANLDLKEAKDVADAANRAKTEFLSGMSHELRTPMNAILGFSQLLDLSNLDPHRKECVGHILKAGHHLLVLINDVLEISRVEIGEIGLSLEPVDVAGILRDGCHLMQTIARDRGIEITLNPSSEMFVKADRQKLRQVALNLISNGIKYNKEGGTLTITAEQESNGDAVISFVDTGIGMSAESMTKLFTPFERFGAVDLIEGTGLGLALSRSLTEAMGGTLTATSVEGEGSCFTVRMQCTPERVLASSPPPWLDLIPTYEGIEAQILVVEDNLANVALFEKVFAPHPELHLTVATQGRLGLELARAQHPDVILLDLHLPDISGKEVLSTLKRDPDLAGIPVIVVSADAFLDRASELLAAGAFRYITKPFSLVEMTAAVVEALSLRPK